VNPDQKTPELLPLSLLKIGPVSFVEHFLILHGQHASDTEISRTYIGASEELPGGDNAGGEFEDGVPGGNKREGVPGGNKREGVPGGGVIGGAPSGVGREGPPGIEIFPPGGEIAPAECTNNVCTGVA
jgi:hypothetical protein